MQKSSGKDFLSDEKSERQKETLDVVMERGDAWSCGSYLVTMRVELRIKVNMLKMLEQKGRKAQGSLQHC